ncbi:MAG: ATP-binding cassette domain-containing protein [Pseudonocardiaceae bacterium]|nr:ATP-binding cassette domain-containing protein [Pseudonocardiaceae bacterium]
MAEAALRFDGLTKRYPGATALSDVSMEIAPGELRAIIGPNGAGKSTLFGLITGVHDVTAGHVYYFGDDITGRSPSAIVRMGIGRAFQVARLFTQLTVFENTLAAVHAHNNSSWWFFRRLGGCRREHERTDTILEEFDLADVARMSAGVLSQGDKKRLELAMARALDPKVLLLDEPTAGMSPSETEQTVALLRRLHVEGGLTILLTEHDMSVVFALAGEVTVLNQGEVLTSGPPEAVRDDRRVVDVYLGEGT